MKNLQNLKGANALNKKEQQSINGGGGCQVTTSAECNTNAPGITWSPWELPDHPDYNINLGDCCIYQV